MYLKIEYFVVCKYIHMYVDRNLSGTKSPNISLIENL